MTWILTIAFDLLIFFALMLMAKYYDGYTIKGSVLEEIEDIGQAIEKSQFWNYLLWALLQQALVIGLYCLLKYVIKFPVLYCVSISAFVMALLHYPNIILLFAVFGMEFFLLSMFSMTGWLYIPLMAFTHGLLASALLKFYPEPITKNFLVLWVFWKAYKK